MSKYGQNNLTGVRVAHDFDDFLEDREVILTLKDTYLLDNQDVNRDSDVLENIDLSENFRHEVRQEGKKKVSGLLSTDKLMVFRPMTSTLRENTEERRKFCLNMMRSQLKRF